MDIYQLLIFLSYLVFIAFVCNFLLKKAIYFFPRWGWKDRFESHSTHTVEKPRGGGIVLALLFFASLPLFLPWDQKLFGFLLSGLLIVGINFLDDRFRIAWWKRLLVEIVGALIIVFSGIEIAVLTNPFNDTALFLDSSFPLFSKVLTVFWILIFINMMNWVDGIDGLATGIGGISSIVLFVLSLLPFVNQPGIAQVALILAVLLVVFLKFNFFPAKIKLGDTGATFIGFVLAILAIFSSAKIATFFLVLGIPLLDVVWVVGRRVFIEKKSPMQGDKKHLHHRLLRLGLSVRQVCYLLYALTAILGLVALVLNGAAMKLAAILLMCLFTVLFFARVSYLEHEKLGTGDAEGQLE